MYNTQILSYQFQKQILLIIEILKY